jgi:signal transduction histidine kinase
VSTRDAAADGALRETPGAPVAGPAGAGALPPLGSLPPPGGTPPVPPPAEELDAALLAATASKNHLLWTASVLLPVAAAWLVLATTVDLHISLAVLAVLSAGAFSALVWWNARALRRGDTRFLMLTRATSDPVWDWDLVNDRVWLSENIHRAFGWSVAFPGNRQWIRERIHPRDLDRVLTSFAEVIRTGSPTWTVDYQFRCKDGTYRDVLQRALLLRERGQPSRMLGTMLDITERIAIARALRERTEDLERVNSELARSNAELERFAQIASHDLQEPLRTVSSFVQLLSKRYGEHFDDAGRRYAAYAVEGAERMRSLINALLTYSRLDRTDAPVDAEVSLARVLSRVCADLHGSITSSAARVTHDELPTVLGHEGQLSQLLLNLVSNAIKYRRDEPPEIHIGATSERGFWRISVADKGIGIEPQYFERIFVVFQRLHTRETYEGTGIGLAICKRIVERHGGCIWLESSPGAGSTFYFTLPKIGGPPMRTDRIERYTGDGAIDAEKAVRRRSGSGAPPMRD